MINEFKEIESRCSCSGFDSQSAMQILSDVLDFTDTAILIISGLGKVMHVNSCFVELWGCRENWMIDSDIFTVMDFISKKVKDFDKLVDGQSKSLEIAKDLHLKDGRIIQMLSKPLDPANPWKGTLFMFRDITLRKKGLDALRERDEYYEAILELFPEAICIHSKGVIKYANSSAAKLLLLENPKDFIGRSVLEFIAPEDRNIVVYRITQLLEQGKPAPTAKERLIRTDGKEVECEVRATPIVFKGESAVMAMARDLTPQREAERAIRESEAKFRSYVNHSDDGIFIVDCQRRFLDANPAACFMTGYALEEITNLTVKDLLGTDKENLAVGNGHFEEMLRNGKSIREFNLVKKDGSKIIVENNAVFLGNGRYMGVCRDITERKKQEQFRKEIEKSMMLLNEAIEYEKLKTEFFANLSHEFRTPLNIILGALQLLNLYMEENSLEHNIPKILRHNKVIKQNCFRLLRLVNNLIDLTRIDSGFFHLQLKNIDIVELIEDITHSVAEYIETKGIKLLFDTEIEEKIISCDPDKIERIMLNLLSNAVKFTKEGGKIIVSVKQREEWISILVKDDGIGIPKEKQQFIFERFRQADKTLTRSHEGSGIGLSLAKSIVEIHGGSIAVDSEAGKGSEFEVLLPCKISSVQEADYNNHNVDRDYVERIHVEFSDIYS